MSGHTSSEPLQGAPERFHLRSLHIIIIAIITIITITTIISIITATTIITSIPIMCWESVARVLVLRIADRLVANLMGEGQLAILVALSPKPLNP